MESQPQLQAQAPAPAPAQRQPQPQPQPASAAEDETIKKNTDCVYFLASPLTCKKGGECEYRHSDIARLNPRDCWFWLHSNCLNPKCAFRHPPLDGLPGTETPKPTGPSPLFQNVATALTHVVPTGPKPCIFFKKGYCVKGDWCPFLHGPNSMSNKTMPIPEASLAGEPATSKKPFGGVDNSTQEKKVPLTVVAKPVKVTPQPKPSMHVEHAIPKVEFTVNKRAPQTSFVHDFPKYRNVTSDVNGNPSVQRPPLLDEPGSINKKDEEVSREPSPGFDVLVDDERRDDGYYPGENQYGMSREHESHSEYDICRSSDYSSIADIANERYQDPLAYNSHERFKDHRASSEKVSGGRPYARMDSRGQVDELDLRHRLTKHKKFGLRSVINHEHGRDRHVEDQSYGSCRDEQNFSRHENSLGSLLRGRISLPERSSSPIVRDMVRRSDRGTRLSPARQNLSSHKGRIGDRIKGRVEEEAFSNGGRNNGGLYSRRDVISGDSADFAAPKRLSELKNKKNGGEHVNDQQTLGKRKHFMSEDGKRKHFMSEDVKRRGDDVNFEGPKPLKEILKRKKGENVGDGNSSNNEGIVGDNQNGGEDAVNESDKFASVEKTDEEESNVVQSEDNEYEATEEREGKSDYEQAEGEEFELQAGGEEFELYDGEEEEYHGEEEDDDDFAKKMDFL